MSKDKLIDTIHDVIEKATAALEVIHSRRGDFLAGIGSGEVISKIADQTGSDI